MTSEQAYRLRVGELVLYRHGAEGLQNAFFVLQRNVPVYMLSANEYQGRDSEMGCLDAYHPYKTHHIPLIANCEVSIGFSWIVVF